MEKSKVMGAQALADTGAALTIIPQALEFMGRVFPCSCYTGDFGSVLSPFDR